MTYLIFAILFLFLSNRGWLKGFLQTIVGNKNKTTDITDEKILSMIYEKSGLKLSKIKLSSMYRPWAMMGGIPTKPYMIINRDAYENFSKDELEWLFLHEAGHYVLWHNVKGGFLQLFFLLLGLVLLTKYNHLILAVLFGIIFTIFSMQVFRKFEYEANEYSLNKMSNPKGLNNLYKKAKKRWEKRGLRGNIILQRLFYIWNLEIYKDLTNKALNQATSTPRV